MEGKFRESCQESTWFVRNLFKWNISTVEQFEISASGRVAMRERRNYGTRMVSLSPIPLDAEVKKGLQCGKWCVVFFWLIWKKNQWELYKFGRPCKSKMHKKSLLPNVLERKENNTNFARSLLIIFASVKCVGVYFIFSFFLTSRKFDRNNLILNIRTGIW